MDPTPSMIVDSMFHSPEQLLADELVAKVTEEDLQWAKDAGRRRLLCLLLKGWFPVDFSPESAYDILAMGGLGKAGLLQSIVHHAIAAVLKPVTGRLMFTVSSWGRPLDQHKSLKRNGFTCTANFAGFVVCCMGCRAEALLAPRSRLKLQELSF